MRTVKENNKKDCSSKMEHQKYEVISNKSAKLLFKYLYRAIKEVEHEA